MAEFDEARLDDPAALAAADERLRELAESGARVRREAGEAGEAILRAVAERGGERPRAVIAAGPDSRLLRAVLEPWCPVPFVAWPAPGLPGWAGSLDLVVMLAPQGSDPAAASAVAEAVRRGCQVVVACRPGSMVAEHAEGRWSTLLPTTTGDQLATAVVMLDFLHRVGLGPACAADEVAASLDEVAVASSPHTDLAGNPAKELAIALAEALPLVWGGSTLAARAARRLAEQFRRSSGRSALAGDAEHLLPVIEATRPRNLFDDPVDGSDLRPLLLVLDDGADDPVVREQRGRLQTAAARSGVRVETLASDAVSEVARYASLLLAGTYAAEYLAVGLAGE
ncbi:SIS domain-containing protein [Nocardioides jiangxiensis]|uniref:SIS domain-containing protein n=1 Tax=Nocardioides jiangxiensis TaxID=3064524 RepID=A0ABT9AY31_9ACTN|nr:SIS domain-containing protein [Nocardioides sp. WY-20]MDO7867476.1 SIS domain-containing protein [Nocardioides sp. WY-20]